MSNEHSGPASESSPCAHVQVSPRLPAHLCCSAFVPLPHVENARGGPVFPSRAYRACRAWRQGCTSGLCSCGTCPALPALLHGLWGGAHSRGACGEGGEDLALRPLTGWAYPSSDSPCRLERNTVWKMSDALGSYRHLFPCLSARLPA